MKPHSQANDLLKGHERGERSTKIVIAITAIMMVGEIVSGILFGSMALLADGWHMFTHVAAFGITLFAYWFAKKHANNPFFKFGTGKVSVLGGFASAIALVVVALVMAIESVGRFFSPEQILFNEAIVVAIIGLAVNLGCAKILHESGHDDHHNSKDHEHGHHHDHHDHNLKAAYLHVLADALTSVFAIVALIVGKFYGWLWLDALMGIVGAAVITKWAWGLLAETSSILLDGGDFGEKEASLVEAIETVPNTKVSDMRLWRVATRFHSVSLRVDGAHERIAEIRTKLQSFSWISHSAIELETVDVNHSQVTVDLTPGHPSRNSS